MAFIALIIDLVSAHQSAQRNRRRSLAVVDFSTRTGEQDDRRWIVGTHSGRARGVCRRIPKYPDVHLALVRQIHHRSFHEVVTTYNYPPQPSSALHPLACSGNRRWHSLDSSAQNGVRDDRRWIVEARWTGARCPSSNTSCSSPNSFTERFQLPGESSKVNLAPTSLPARLRRGIDDGHSQTGEQEGRRQYAKCTIARCLSSVLGDVHLSYP